MTLSSLLLRTVAVLGVALPGAALAEPVLRGDIVVDGAIVTVADMFADAGDMAGTGLFRAPAPGTTGTVTLAQIEAAASQAGLDAFDANGLAEIRVARAGVMVDETLLEDLIAADLRARGVMTDAMSLSLSFDALPSDLVAAEVESPARLEMLHYQPGAARFSARFAIAGASAPLDLAGQIQMMIETPHLVASLPAGAILSPSDIEMRNTPLVQGSANAPAALEDLVGMQLRRALREGVVVRAADVGAPELVARNAEVTVIYRSGALTLTTRGQALNAASLNQPVSVLNPMSRKVLHGVAAADGTVIVTSAPQAVAGL